MKIIAKAERNENDQRGKEKEATKERKYECDSFS